MEKIRHIVQWMQRLLAAFVAGRPQPGLGWLPWTWLAVLYLLGLFLWGQFLNWGRIPFDFHDWAEISAPRIAFVRDAVLTGQLPLHMPDTSALRGVTDRFMVIPDVMLTPQMFLLGVMEVGPFMLANVWLLYTLGVAGLVYFQRRYGLSPLAYGILFLLFNFNGHLLAHYSVGHANWGGYFLFPWLAALVLRLIEEPELRHGPRSWRWTAAVAFLLFFILLQGSFHHFIWGLMFLGLLAVFSWQYLPVVLRTLVLSGLLAAVRLLPPALGMGLFDDEFLSGYPTVWDIVQAMFTLRLPADALSIRNMINPLGWWEYDLYLGILGAGFFLFFGVYRTLRNHRQPYGYAELLLPAALMVFLSVGRIYRAVMLIPFPLLSAERVSARMLILPFVFFLLLGAMNFQRWLDARRLRPEFQLIGLAAWGLVLHDLWQHLKLWRVNVAFEAFPLTPVNLATKTVSNHPDAPYTNLLAAGLALTLLTACGLGYMLWRSRKRRAS